MNRGSALRSRIFDTASLPNLTRSNVVFKRTGIRLAGRLRDPGAACISTAKTSGSS